MKGRGYNIIKYAILGLIMLNMLFKYFPKQRIFMLNTLKGDISEF